jgi:hypothetical protein
MKKFLVPFAFLAISWTVVVAFAYVGIQQNYRQNANDPQIQDVEDVITALNSGQQLNLQPDGTDLSSSLSTFIALYDKDGKVLSSNAVLNGNPPQLPAGVFSYVNKHGEDRITWQPQKGIREAVVVGKISSSGQYIAVGRSLREIDKRTNTLTGMAAIAWVVLVLLSLFGCYVAVEGCPCPKCLRKRDAAKGEEKSEDMPHEHNHEHVHEHSEHVGHDHEHHHEEHIHHEHKPEISSEENKE